MTSSQLTRPAGSRPSGGMRDLLLIGRQVRYEQLSFWLNPVGAIFTVGFSVIFLVLLGATAGSSRVSYLGNIKLIQYYVPGFVAYGVMSACFNSLTMLLVNRREMGLLKRLRLSPLPTWALLGAIFVSTLIVAFARSLEVPSGHARFRPHTDPRAGGPSGRCIRSRPPRRRRCSSRPSGYPTPPCPSCWLSGWRELHRAARPAAHRRGRGAAARRNGAGSDGAL